MRSLTIGEAARQAGVGVETIRFYERRGLIEQPPKPARVGYRVYPDEVVKRVRFIRQAQQIGFSLREIEELLSLRADPMADCSMVREQAVTKLEEVWRKMGQLREIGAALEGLIAVCPGHGGLQACSILETLADTSEGAAAPTEGSGPLPGHRPPKKRARTAQLNHGKQRSAT